MLYSLSADSLSGKPSFMCTVPNGVSTLSGAGMLGGIGVEFLYCAEVELTATEKTTANRTTSAKQDRCDFIESSSRISHAWRWAVAGLRSLGSYPLENNSK